MDGPTTAMLLAMAAAAAALLEQRLPINSLREDAARLEEEVEELQGEAADIGGIPYERAYTPCSRT